MKNIMVVLAVFAVLVGVSTCRQAFVSDEAASEADDDYRVEEAAADKPVYESFINDRPASSPEEYVPPETSGTITCSGTGPTIKVVIEGNLMTGLTSLLPLKMMRRVSLAKEGRACWGSCLWSVCAITQPICIKERDRRLVCQTPTDVHVVFSNVPRMSFVPQIGGYGVFDLRRWKVAGCVREGCDGVCHDGEKCRSGPSCTINGN